MAAMFQLMDTDIEVQDAPGAPALVVRRPTLAFDNVVFGYDRDRTILHGLSFEVPAGSHVAIVGPSGAGKSTIARLMFRFYDPWQGRILIDGQDIREVTQASLRAQIGIVPQDSVLFNDTIGYNIAYGRDGAGQAEVEAAARGAALMRADRAAAAGLRHRSRRARAETVGRREAARRDRPHPGQEPADPAARRGDQRARYPHRTGHPRHAAPVSRTTAPACRSPTGFRPSPMPTRSSCSTRAGWPKAARTPNCCAATGSMPRCGRGRRSEVEEGVSEAAE